jgi:hypothetical protein
MLQDPFTEMVNVSKTEDQRRSEDDGSGIGLQKASATSIAIKLYIKTYLGEQE